MVVIVQQHSGDDGCQVCCTAMPALGDCAALHIRATGCVSNPSVFLHFDRGTIMGFFLLPQPNLKGRAPFKSFFIEVTNHNIVNKYICNIACKKTISVLDLMNNIF
jgi:hypothetical protein